MVLKTPDRSFQFGRLLAVLERVELDYYKKSGKYRETTANKNMSIFRQRPLDGYDRVSKWLETAYIPRTPAWAVSRYRKLVGEIMDILAEFTPAELNKPVGNTFLLGYSPQRNDFYKRNPNEDPAEASDEESIDE